MFDVPVLQPFQQPTFQQIANNQCLVCWKQVVFEACSFLCCFESNSGIQVVEMIVRPPYESLDPHHVRKRGFL